MSENRSQITDRRLLRRHAASLLLSVIRDPRSAISSPE